MKKILLGLSIAVAAMSSQASYLLWQVTDTVVAGDACLSTLASDETASYVTRLRAGESGKDASTFSTYMDDGTFAAGVQDTGFALGTFNQAASLSVADGGAMKVDLGTIAADSTTQMYYVEILKWDSVNNAFTQVAVSQMQSYADLSGNGYVGNELIDIPNVTIWAGTSYAVPEPTGGMLVMMGLAFLGLKRRRT